jgi:hypothetical protein
MLIETKKGGVGEVRAIKRGVIQLENASMVHRVNKEAKECKCKMLISEVVRDCVGH